MTPGSRNHRKWLAGASEGTFVIHFWPVRPLTSTSSRLFKLFNQLLRVLHCWLDSASAMKYTKNLDVGALHIANNFNIYGFSSESLSLLQCVKELFENSIDACKELLEVESSPSVSVVLTMTEEDPNLVLIHVTDDGVGMKNSQKLLRCFESTKVAKGDYSTGRFGVGLSTCLIYSLIHSNYPMRIITKTQSDELCSVTDFILDNSGNPIATNSSDQTVSMISGTRISIYMPIDADTNLLQGK